MTVEMKRCFRCGEEKPLHEFYTHPGTADGHLGKCKDCARADRRRYESGNPSGILKTRLAMCEKSPTRANASRAVEAAIKAGAITRPHYCYGCGCGDSEHRIEAHHHDYSKPLEVIWLCTPCHRRMDAQRRIREGKKPYGRSKGDSTC